MPQKIRCIWEHNGNDSLLYAENFIGAFSRGKSKDIALNKMKQEVASYLKWRKLPFDDSFEVEIVQEKISELDIKDADSDVLFQKEKAELSPEEYLTLKELALASARDFLSLYEMIPDKHKSCLSPRKTFYGTVPCTASEMYEHTKSVNSYYFGEIGVEVDNFGSILECRERGFALLEEKGDFLKNNLYLGNYDEEWTLRKVLRRFVWHDRIHAKAMYRMAIKTFGEENVPNVFNF